MAYLTTVLVCAWADPPSAKTTAKTVDAKSFFMAGASQLGGARCGLFCGGGGKADGSRDGHPRRGCAYSFVRCALVWEGAVARSVGDRASSGAFRRKMQGDSRADAKIARHLDFAAVQFDHGLDQ